MGAATFIGPNLPAGVGPPPRRSGGRPAAEVSSAAAHVRSNGMGRFAFLTNHGLVLLCIAEDPRVRMREIAATVQITERAAQRIVADLIEAGYVDRARDGRRNRYTVRRNLPITLPSRRDIELNSLLTVLMPVGSSHARRDEMESGTQPAAGV